MRPLGVSICLLWSLLSSRGPLAAGSLWTSVLQSILGSYAFMPPLHPPLPCLLLLLLGEQGMSAQLDLKLLTGLTEVGSDEKCSKETCMFGKREQKVRDVDFVFQGKNHTALSGCGIRVVGTGSKHTFLTVFLSILGPSTDSANTCPGASPASVSPPVRSKSVKLRAHGR